MTDYNVKHTDRTVPTIPVPETEVNDTALGVTLFGRINPEYGETLDAELLNILENFACPEVPPVVETTISFIEAVPDLTQTTNEQLSRPTVGQFWFNSTRQMMYGWDGVKWSPISLRENYAANWGSVLDGQQLPKPVSAVTGHVFEYQDCIWSVSPAAFTGKFSSMVCSADSEANVTMQYRLAGPGYNIIGLANYLIIGIRGNYNTGQQIEITPSPTPTVSVAASPTPGPSMTPTPTRVASPTPTPSVTPTMGVSSTPAPSPTSTPDPTRTPTPTVSITPSPSPPPPVQPGLRAFYGGGCYVRTGGAGSSISYFMRFDTNGDVTEGSSLALATQGNRGNWLGTLPGDSAANYDIMFVGDAPNGLSSATWYNLGTPRSYSWNYILSGPSGGRFINGNFTLRRTAGFVTIDTAPVLQVQLGINTECQ